MNITYDDLSKKVLSASMNSTSISATKTPVYHNTSSAPIANPFERLNADLNEIKMMLQVLLGKSK